MVAMGCGIGVVPKLVLDHSPMQEHIRTLDVSPALEPFTVGACTTRSALRGPAVKAFWEVAEKVSNPDPSTRGSV
jgi:LysR family positive regulator for ilvC